MTAPSEPGRGPGHEPGHGPVHDLAHHGDAETGPDLIDLAVNVRLPAPPEDLAAVIRGTVAHLAHYPDPGPAREALARRHGVTTSMVLPCAGAAEAFTLLARAGFTSATVVHPQFTEPEAALHRAGVAVHRHVLDGDFTLDPARMPGAELTVVGNPTNPTGVLHERAALRAAHDRAGGVLAVDEAFLDEVVDGEEQSLIAPRMPDRVVIRSLTKTWGLAGLRAGYVVGDPELIARLADQQPPWSVSTPALAVMVATAADSYRARERALAAELAPWRSLLVDGLQERGIPVVPSVSPFVLARPGAGVRERLRGDGIAVRRGDTFPGLDATWVRIAVRAPATTRTLLTALDRVAGTAAD